MKYTTNTTNDIVVNGHEILSPPKDAVVEAVRDDLLRRSQVGIKKYNTTLERNDLSTLEWLQHAQEEAMDFVLYLERLKQEYKLNK